jgi:hemerythrin
MTPTGSKPPVTPGGEPSAGPGPADVASRFAWRPEYLIGIEEIDAQHQELFRRAGLFIESLHRQSRQEVGIVLSFLRFYAVTHFGAEEAWMREARYPGLAEHKKLHDQFIKDVLALSDKHLAKKGQGIEPDSVSEWLEKWLTHHVTQVDTDLARHLRSSGPPRPRQ